MSFQAKTIIWQTCICLVPSKVRDPGVMSWEYATLLDDSRILKLSRLVLLKGLCLYGTIYDL